MDTIDPKTFFLDIADNVDSKEWEETQFKNVDRLIDKCEALANLCEVRGYKKEALVAWS